MAQKMQLTDGTNILTFSPKVSPEYDRPDARYRGMFRSDSGDVQLYDLGGAQRHLLALNNLSKTDADQLNAWWRNLSILSYLPDTEENINNVYAHINGSTQYFYRNDADFPESGITGATDLTIVGWIKSDDISGNKWIVAKQLLAGDKRMYYFRVSGAELTIAISSDGTSANTTTKTTSGVGLVAGIWQHIAAVYDASAGTADFYKNGVFVEQETGLKTSIADKDPDFTIGGPSNPFSGALFNIALYNAKVNPADILAAANDRDYDHSGEANIIGCWKFDDDGDAVFIDNGQGDAGRDLKPYDGGDETFANCGRTTAGIYARIQGTQAPIQMDFPTGWQGKYEGALTIHEVSSSSGA